MAIQAGCLSSCAEKHELPPTVALNVSWHMAGKERAREREREKQRTEPPADTIGSFPNSQTCTHDDATVSNIINNEA